MRLEPPVQEYAEGGGGQVHQSGVAPPLLRPALAEPGPEGRHLFLDLQHDLTSEGLAELVLPGQRHHGPFAPVRMALQTGESGREADLSLPRLEPARRLPPNRKATPRDSSPTRMPPIPSI